MDEFELDPVVSFKPSADAVKSNENHSLDRAGQTNTQNLNEEVADVEKNNVEENLEANNYDNKAFELEDVEINAKTNPFYRPERPGSMMSIKSSVSTTSRLSINCINGRVRCPNMRLQRFYSYRSDIGFLKVSEELKALILPEKDGQFVGNWLLIEISNWDFHREKVVLLTEKTLIIVAYNFIKSRIENYNRIELKSMKKVSYGSLKYPKKSFMAQYDYGAVKLCWGEENLSFLQKWNPFSEKIPFLILTSHHILYNEKEKETAIYNCDELINSLEFVISKLPEKSDIEIKQEDIEIENYANLMSVLYNQNWLGFQLDRNGVSF